MKPIALEDFCNFTFLANVTFSPEGGSACFGVTRIQKEKNSYASCLYVYRQGKTAQLTAGGKELRFQYLDEDTILFQGNREEEKDKEDISSRFYKISLLGGEASLAFTLPIPVQQVWPLKNGDYLALGSVTPGFEKLYTGEEKVRKAFLQAKKEGEDYEVVETVPWWFNGDTFTRRSYGTLYYYDAKKKKLRPLTAEGVDISDVKLSKDESTVYYSRRENTAGRQILFDGEQLYALELAAGKERPVALSRKGFVINGYELGESFMLLLAMDEKYGLNTDPDFYRLDYATGEITLLCRYGESIGSSVGADIRYGGGKTWKMEGDTFYFISTRFDSAGLYKLEGGKISQLVDRPGSVDCFDIHGDKLLMVALFDMKGQELYDGRGRRLTRFNEGVLRGKYVAQPEELRFMSQGHEIHGFVLKPMDYVPGKKYPVILDIHGGPKTVYGPVFYHEMQHWAGRGYFVIFCNPTGSDGRGGFMDIRGKYGTVDYEDIMTFCDEALKAYPDMDEKNFFETGGSYGGFMTNWIIGHTNRFRACASQRSISNWVSFYGVSDIGPGFAEDQNDTTLWPSAEKLWAHSPLKYADKVTTPTLFIHSFEDYRCPIDQGYQMYTALAVRGVESKMVLFRGENHELSRSGKPQHRIRRLKEITDWFENHREK